MIGKRIAILGAGGFIGTHLARDLAADCSELTLVSRRFHDQAPDLAHVRRIEAEFADTTLMGELTADADVVINLVSGSTPRYSPTGADGEARANVIPQIAFLELMAQRGRGRLIFFSSGGAVYGNPPTLPASETCPTNPISLYGLSKLTIEKHLELFQATMGLDTVILRLGNVYGPGQLVKRRQGVLAAAFAATLSSRRFRLVGSGDRVRDYVFIDDVVAALRAVLNRPDGPERIFNIASGTGTTTFDVLRAVEACSGVKLEIDRVDASAQEVGDIVLDISRARSVLGWAPSTLLHDGIAQTFRHVASDRFATPEGFVGRAPAVTIA